MNTKIWKHNLRTLLTTPGHYYVQLPKKHHFDVIEVMDDGVVKTLDGNIVNTENLPCIIKFANLTEYLHEANHQMESSERKLAGVRGSRKRMMSLLDEAYDLLNEMTDPEINNESDCRDHCECKCHCDSKENKKSKECLTETKDKCEESDKSETESEDHLGMTIKLSYGSKTKITCKKAAEIAIKLALSKIIQTNFGKVTRKELKNMIVDFIEDNFYIKSTKCDINVEFLKDNDILIEFFNPTSKTDRFLSNVEFTLM